MATILRFRQKEIVTQRLRQHLKALQGKRIYSPAPAALLLGAAPSALESIGLSLRGRGLFF
jgi:hypothetical protein